MGIMFSAGVLVSASLIHMLPHSTEVLDEYFAAEDDHSDETAAEHAAHADDDHFAMAEQDGATDDHWDNGRILRRWLEEDHDDHGHEEEEGDSHADHNHAFPWSQTFFSVTFLFLLMIEATLERFIDVHFRGKYGNLFHANDGEEIMYAKGRTATPDKAVRAFQEQEHALHISEQKSQAGTEAERAEVAKKAIEEDMVPDVIKNKCHNDDSSVQLHDYECNEGHGDNCRGHGHDIDHASAVSKSNSHIISAAESGHDTEVSSSESLKEDTQPVAKPPGPEADVKMSFPNCEDCLLSYKAPLPDCIDCKILTGEDLEYENTEDNMQHHHHHKDHSHRRNASGGNKSVTSNGLPKKRHSCRSNEVISDLESKSVAMSQRPNGMFQSAKRRNSGTSFVSGKSSMWGKTAGRPAFVNFAVTAPQNELLEQQQTINPWVSILLTLVLSIHVILEGLTVGSTTDVETIKATFVAVCSHKGFASFSLGSSLVASGYWENNRTMFFVLAAVFVAIDIISVGAGMGLQSQFEQNGQVATAVLQALLGGSFLFVATIELIPGELETMRRHSLPLMPIMVSLCTGFALMTLLAKWGV